MNARVKTSEGRGVKKFMNLTIRRYLSQDHRTLHPTILKKKKKKKIADFKKLLLL